MPSFWIPFLKLQMRIESEGSNFFSMWFCMPGSTGRLAAPSWDSKRGYKSLSNHDWNDSVDVESGWRPYCYEEACCMWNCGDIFEMSARCASFIGASLLCAQWGCIGGGRVFGRHLGCVATVSHSVDDFVSKATLLGSLRGCSQSIIEFCEATVAQFQDKGREGWVL